MPLRSVQDAFDTQPLSLGPRGTVTVSTVHAYGMSNVLYVCYSTNTCIPLCRYNDFLICCGMVHLVQVDGIWHKSHLAYNKYMVPHSAGKSTTVYSGYYGLMWRF